MFQFTTLSEESTKQLAERIGQLLQANDVLTLDGDLGAGKTTFTKGLASGLDVKRTVNSPTFTIVKQYRGRLPLFHMDVYRLEDSEEDIGFDDYFDSEGVTVIEWSRFIEEFLPSERLRIYIEKTGDDKRLITLTPYGSRFERLCEEIKS
ncbi:tRNA (adenosine(37)-N6)-threonylcarbamoyltransferase complex ATPase subunit type 1 TsaE [Alkalibacillus sp. S2W]|uniref:tRNA (adenosine(37)-N6)-threonylcarbamoyltransferase complex ATPase subunit type 1 TsaE n=1 Tax=Alkalibacillus sp. S2W TaxID=3386553 RepID=UPI00398D38CD